MGLMSPPFSLPLLHTHAHTRGGRRRSLCVAKDQRKVRGREGQRVLPGFPSINTTASVLGLSFLPLHLSLLDSQPFLLCPLQHPPQCRAFHSLSSPLPFLFLLWVSSKHFLPRYRLIKTNSRKGTHTAHRKTLYILIPYTVKTHTHTHRLEYTMP